MSMTHVSQMSEAKMTPLPPCFGAKIFDFQSFTMPILTPKNTLLHFENVAVFHINKTRTYSTKFLKLKTCEHMPYINWIT